MTENKDKIIRKLDLELTFYQMEFSKLLCRETFLAMGLLIFGKYI